MPLWKKRQPEPEARVEPSIRFVGEQDGEPERELKDAMSALFTNEPDVRAAYLALVVFSGVDQPQVVLCLASPENPQLAARAGDVFTPMFGNGAFLDMLFLSEEQEGQLEKVCRPFYSLGRQAHGAGASEISVE